jgi:hypothetical protein
VPYEPLDKERITTALRRLGELAAKRKSSLEVSLYGGAVFTMIFGSRGSTKDVDAIVHPSNLAKKLILQVAREQDLPDDWINDDARFFLADREAKRKLKGGEFGPGLQVSVPTAAYLLAMKLRACRAPLPGYAGDYADIEFLLHKMEISSLAGAETIYDRFFPNDPLPEITSEVIRQAILKLKRS